VARWRQEKRRNVPDALALHEFDNIQFMRLRTLVGHVQRQWARLGEHLWGKVAKVLHHNFTVRLQQRPLTLRRIHGEEVDYPFVDMRDAIQPFDAA
jgi:hypothetical protein